MKSLSLGGAAAVREHPPRDPAQFSKFSEIVLGGSSIAAAEQLAAGIHDDRVRIAKLDAALAWRSHLSNRKRKK